MKYTPLLALSALSFLILFSCKKDGSSPNHPVDPLMGNSVKINVAALLNVSALQSGQLNNFELVLSENNGKVLLDTVVSYNITIAATLQTTQPVLDITTIEHEPDTTLPPILVSTIKNISTSMLASYKILDTAVLPPLPQLPTTTGHIHYTNLPAAPTPYLFAHTRGGGSSVSILPYGSVDFAYDYAPGDYTYLFFPSLGLYNLHRIQSAYDIVDLTKMDTVEKIKFNRPAAYKKIVSVVTAYPDSSDHNSGLPFGSSPISVPSVFDADFMYPGKKYFQSYKYSILGHSDDGLQTAYVNGAGTTIPTNLPFPDDTWFNLGVTDNNNFSVKFTTPSSVIHLYSTVWSSSTIDFELTVPTDSTTLHPLDILTALAQKSLLLKGQTLSQIKFGNINFNYKPDVSSYINYIKAIN